MSNELLVCIINCIFIYKNVKYKFKMMIYLKSYLYIYNVIFN